MNRKAGMERRMRITRRAPAILAALMVCALTACSVASAATVQPEFRSSSKFPIHFTLANTGAITMGEEELRGAATCSKLSGEGEITAHRSATIKSITLSGCSPQFRHCYKPGGAATELQTTELLAIPVFTSRASGLVALELKPKTGTTMANLECPGAASNSELKGSILLPIPSRNLERETKTLGMTFERQGGTQVPSQYEGENGELIGSWMEFGYVKPPSFWTRDAWGGPVTMTTASAIEIQD
jgi:hypothetical protein